MKRILHLIFFTCCVYAVKAQLPAPQALPFSQNWTNTGQITTNDVWTGVSGIIGFRGDDITTVTGTDPQTLLVDNNPGVVDVNANQTNPNTNTTGGVTEFEITDPVVALQGSGTADAPYLLIAINTSCLQNITVSYNLRDIDGSADNAVQPVALHYRVGGTGAYTNVAAAFVADATTGPSIATLVTPVSVTLPAACNNQTAVYLRIMTTNAAGNDEWVGIDDISINGSPLQYSATISGSGSFCISGNLPIDVAITGAGASPYTVVYTDGFSNYTATNYTPGNSINQPVTFTSNFTLVSVTDANNCTATTLSGTATATVSETLPSITFTTVPPTCANDDGEIDINVTGGFPPYTYAWTTLNGSGLVPANEDQTGLSAGDYTVVATDFNGCSSSATVISLPEAQGCDCMITDAGLSNITCDDNDTPTNPTDDFIIFDLNPTGVNLGQSGYNVTVNAPPGGTVTLLNGNPATNVPYGMASTFRFENGSAGGGNNYLLTVTDVINGSACSFSAITVTDPGECSVDPCDPDNDPPSITCPSGLTVDCANAVPPVATSGQGAPTAEDACGSVTISHVSDETSNQSCANRFTLTRTYRAVDGSGNSADCQQTIVVNDQTPPVISGPEFVTVNCDQNVPANTGITATDNCGGTVTLTSSDGNPISGDCAQEESIVRTWTATDVCGNSTQFIQTINIVDNTPPQFTNPGSLPQNLTISCSDPLPVPPVLEGIDNCDLGAIPEVIWINEIHYDNAGTDVGEFVEIAGTAGIDLTQYAIVLYNGNGGVTYDSDNLTGTIPDQGGGFGTFSLPYPVNGLQNGTPDGLALVKLPMTVVQFLSYEGPFLATNGPAAGMTSVDIGVAEEPAPPVGSSLHLTGTGDSYDDFTWSLTADDSPGNINTGQTIMTAPATIMAVFSEMMGEANCPGEAVVIRKWTLTDGCGNMNMHTQIITLEDNTPPAIAAPANVTLNCNDPLPSTVVVVTDNCDPNSPLPKVWINEIHYDNTGNDVGEFIEVAGTAGTDLSSYALFLYNGSGGGTYGSLALSGIIDNENNGFGAVSFPFPVNGIQNGSPDGIALVKGGMVLQFLSYEGTFTAVGGPANGNLSVDIGVAETGTEPVGQSLRLTGSGNMPNNFVWNAPAAESPGSLNQGQTIVPIQNNIPVMFTETMSVPPGSTCPSDKTITRTWKATDACGNTGTATQIITVTDNKPPTVSCPANITVTLPITGTVTITLANVTPVSATDNCSPSNAVSLTATPLTLTCANQNTTNAFVIKGTDQCGNMGTCTTNIFVPELARCTPKILVSDPCICKNNATNLSDGQFGEIIKIESLTGKTWTVTAVNGLFSASSPNPPAAPIAIAPGTKFIEQPAGSGDYYLNGIHIDDLGYTITVISEIGQVLTIGNKCAYPNPVITAELDGDFCLFSDPVPLTGNPGDNNIVSAVFTVNGVQTTVFDPSQGVGLYVIEYKVNGGTPKAAGADDPGCIISVKKFINVVATPTTLTCNDLVYVSLDATCEAEILPDDILEGTYGCFDDYKVEITNLLGTINYGNTVTTANLGQTLKVKVTHLVSGNFCWGNLKVEDKLAPAMVCQDIYVSCGVTNYTPSYLKNVLGINVSTPTVTDCSSFTLTYTDSYVDLPCNGSINGVDNLSAYLLRKWTAKDAWNNIATCNQYIYVTRRTANDVLFPADTVISCADANTDPSNTGAPYILDYGVKFFLYPNQTVCELNALYTDTYLPICKNAYKIVRKWTVLDWCSPTNPFPPDPNPREYIQVVTVMDQEAPLVISCPTDQVVSVDPLVCCSTFDLPDAILSDDCSGVASFDVEIAAFTSFDYFSQDSLAIYKLKGSLADFPGNNHWAPDTLGVIGNMPCLPPATHHIYYIATDECGNTASCYFEVMVKDLVPPAVACDALTQVSVGLDGTVKVNASTFDDGSYDICMPVEFKARRMFPNDCQSVSLFQDQVMFCCEDIGDTVTVILRVYDVDVPEGPVSPTLSEPHFADCMVEVIVEDKIKPACLPPAPVTVSCENFDPSLWSYGFADGADNCCFDTITETRSYTQFDTVCGKGTITRTFRAFDCYGLSSQCTQRVVVNYEQDYYVRFPDDKIIQGCNGSGDYGVPTFFGEDCELLASSYEDVMFTVVPDACFKIERTWTVINWCTYNPNAGCINVPNPNPNPIANHVSNLPGPIVSPITTVGDPWRATVVKINATDPQTSSYTQFWNANANCYRYKQIIKIIDGEAPTGTSVQPTCDNQNWTTVNDPNLWNAGYYWDPVLEIHDLCEEPTDLCITATDDCSGANLNIEYLLFLDLNGDGVMETVVNSQNLPGANTVFYGSALNPNYIGGTPYQFDFRPVALGQKWGFTIQETVSGNNRTACVKFNTFSAQNNFVSPQLPHGKHKIKWIVSDGCGNDRVYEYDVHVKDCKAPTVVCKNGLSVNIMPTGMISVWALDLVQYGEDNCTPASRLVYGIRKAGTGSGFPLNPDGTPVTGVTFTCDELGQQPVEIWVMDAAGNADFCLTYVIVQDNNGNCDFGPLTVSGAVKSQLVEPVENVSVLYSSNTQTKTDLTDTNGNYMFDDIAIGESFTITPTRDDNPLNGVSTFDLVLMSKHILGIEPLGSPYKMIAADANKSGSITTFDIVEFRKLVLGIYSELPGNTSWRFIDSAYVFPEPTNPFLYSFPETASFDDVQESKRASFVGIKIGDVNNSAVPSLAGKSDDRTSGTAYFDIEDRNVEAGTSLEVHFVSDVALSGFQMTLPLQGLALEEIISSDRVNPSNFGVFKNTLTVSIDGARQFTLRFKALQSGKLSEMIGLGGTITRAEAYAEGAAQPLSPALRFKGAGGEVVHGLGYELYQNQPNPFVDKTYIGFHLPKAEKATLLVFDAAGRLVYTAAGNFEKGYQYFGIQRSELPEGVLRYSVQTESWQETKSMIRVK